MIQPSCMSEQLLFTTVRIVSTQNNGEVSFGTGFFFKHKFNDGNEIHIVVTNKHVLVNSNKVELLFHESDDNRQVLNSSFSVTLNTLDGFRFDHPQAEIDLAAILISAFVNTAKSMNKNLFYLTVDEDIAWDANKLRELRAVEDLLMVGYPIGLWDEKNNLPLVRKGISSTHPMIDFNDKPIGIADIACFPGSSGSPIFIANEGGYSTKNGFNVSSRIVFLGVLFAGPTNSVHGNIHFEEIPTANKFKSSFQTMIHLGFYIKAREVVYLANFIVDELKKAGRN